MGQNIIIIVKTIFCPYLLAFISQRWKKKADSLMFQTIYDKCHHNVDRRKEFGDGVAIT